MSRLGVASEEKELVVHPGPSEVPVILSVLPYLAGTITLIRAGIDFIRYLRSKGKAPFVSLATATHIAFLDLVDKGVNDVEFVSAEMLLPSAIFSSIALGDLGGQTLLGKGRECYKIKFNGFRFKNDLIGSVYRSFVYILTNGGEIRQINSKKIDWVPKHPKAVLLFADRSSRTI